MTWNLTDAKNRLSELLKLVHTEGPQVITRHNRDGVVVISEAEYQRLKGSQPSFKDLLFSGPKLEGLNLERDNSSMRDVSV